jgi:FKBP-type peptidyl-prolyl cis-trans isomerase FkpA
MLRILSFVIVMAVFFAACSSDGTSNTVKTPSGFPYEHSLQNEGPKPAAGEYAYFHVSMSNGDSTTFDSHDQPDIPRIVMPDLTDPQNNKPSPIVEAISVMSVGDKLTLYYPLDSLKGNPPPGYEGAENIIYNIELTDIQTAEEFQEEQNKMMAAAQVRFKEVEVMAAEYLNQYKAGELDDQVQTTDSGLKYIIHEEGEGSSPQQGQTVFANYYGMLVEDGSMFDNSFARGREFSFPVGQGRVIRGWDEGFQLLKKGAKATLIIPSDLGYGEAGSPPKIPGNAELAFYVELVNFQ